MPIHVPFWGVFFGKNKGQRESFSSFIVLGMQQPGTDVLRINQTASKLLLRFSLWSQQQLGSQKRKKTKKN